ncbi:MAG: hypothetical protein EOO54_23830 [Haliea sp.]|nr:MAG: hypothetical protein EOO54_23830 [Haliea sp.]
MRLNTFLATLAVQLAVCSGSAQAQPAGPAKAPQASASAPGAIGPGGGAGRGMGPRFGRDYTPGWPMMTGKERAEHRRRMADARTADECRVVRDEHRKLMEQRAKERGMAGMPGPRYDACRAFGG